MLITAHHADGDDELLRQVIDSCGETGAQSLVDRRVPHGVIQLDVEQAPQSPLRAHEATASDQGTVNLTIGPCTTPPGPATVSSGQRGTVRRLLITVGSPRPPTASSPSAQRSWQARTIGLMALMQLRGAELIVYLPQGCRRLRELTTPTAGDDRYARLRPSDQQLRAARQALLAQPPQLADHAVLPLALPGRSRLDEWRRGQPVEPVPGCWVADSRDWAATAGYNAARTAAVEAARHHLGARTGGVGLVIVDRTGQWSAQEVPVHQAAPSPQTLLAH